MRSVALWLSGQPPRKSNARVVYRHPTQGYPIIAKSEKAREWEEAALQEIPEEAKLKLGSLTKPVLAIFIVVLRNMRADLSVELVTDTLQRAGVLADDRYIWVVQMCRCIDKTPGHQGVACLLIEEDTTEDVPIWVQELAYDMPSAVTEHLKGL